LRVVKERLELTMLECVTEPLTGSTPRRKGEKMQSKAAENLSDHAVNLAHLTHEVTKAKDLIDDVLEDSKRKAERMLKLGTVAVEDCVEDTTYFIKRHPWQSVGTALGLGAGFGMLAGWLITRSRSRNEPDLPLQFAER